MNVMYNRQAHRGVALAFIMAAAVASPLLAQPEGHRGGRGKDRVDNAPSVGDEAPNFKLQSKDGSTEVELASFRGKKPVVLIFGSYT